MLAPPGHVRRPALLIGHRSTAHPPEDENGASAPATSSTDWITENYRRGSRARPSRSSAPRLGDRARWTKGEAFAGQSAFLIAYGIEVRLSGREASLGDGLPNIGVGLEVPSLIHPDRVGPAVLVKAEARIVLGGARYETARYCGLDIRVLPEVPAGIDVGAQDEALEAVAEEPPLDIHISAVAGGKDDLGVQQRGIGRDARRPARRSRLRHAFAEGGADPVLRRALVAQHLMRHHPSVELGPLEDRAALQEAAPGGASLRDGLGEGSGQERRAGGEPGHVVVAPVQRLDA